MAHIELLPVGLRNRVALGMGLINNTYVNKYKEYVYNLNKYRSTTTTTTITMKEIATTNKTTKHVNYYIKHTPIIHLTDYVVCMHLYITVVIDL